MSEKNGDKSRFQIARKRRVLLRAKLREMLAPAAAAAEKPAAPAKSRKKT